MRLLLITSLLVLSLSAHGHDQSDVITLYNGDKITGEIKGMSAGLLQLSTDYAATIFIEWQKVAKVNSRYNFEVRLESAERLFGNIAATEKNGVLQFTSIDMAQNFELLEITGIRPIEDTFEDRLNYSIGFNFQLEPELRTNQFNANARYEDTASVTSGTVRLTESLTKLNDSKTGTTQQESTSSALLSIEHQRWTNRAELYRTFTTSYEINEALGNDGRLSVGTGLGRYFIDRPGVRLNSSAGLQGIIEYNALIDTDTSTIPPDSVDLFANESKTDKTHHAVEAFINANWRLYEFGDNDMDIIISGNVYPSLSDWGRVRANLTAQIDWEVYSNFYWTVSATADYDSDSDSSISDDNEVLPDDTPVGTFDYIVTMGISWKP